MRIPQTLHILSLILALSWYFILPATADTGNIILSEVSTAGEKSSDEFVELYNTTDEALDLSGLQLRKRTASGSESSIRVFPKDSLIPARGFFLWGNSGGTYALPFADSESTTSLADNNSIGLFTQSGASGLLIDSVAWGTGAPFSSETPVFSNPEKNVSLSRATGTLTWVVATPSPTNSRGATWEKPEPDPLPSPNPLPNPTPEPLSPVAIHINEILANPTGNEAASEFIELYNDASDAADISGFILRDASKTGRYTFPRDTVIAGHGYLVLPRSVSKISLNNTSETLSLFNTSEILVDRISYEKTKEGVSQNRVGDTLRGGTPTPGADNLVNALPETKERVPKKGYHGVALSFDARGKDSDDGKLKYTWNFGDGHKSYKETTTHRYAENGTYMVTLTTTDGRDDVIETFSLNIESFPKPDLRITALMPNPSGRDSDTEWLMIANRGKKAVDLQGFSIATGWKKLVNHPIREHFVIAPKSEAKLTRSFSLFTLPNQKGKVELRAPDGKVLQDVTYKLDKSVAENAVYFKEKGSRWTWHEEKKKPPLKTIETLPEEIILPDDATEASPLETETLGEDEARVLGVTANTPDRHYLTLLNYGTSVQLPEDLNLTFPEPERISFQTREHYAITFAKIFLEDINLTLNTLQNKTWSGQAL